MEPNTGSERRIETRVQRDLLTVECLPCGPGREFRDVAHSLIDVSTAGARVILKQVMRSGERLSLFFRHHDSVYSACMLGEVRWVAPFTDANGTTMGCVAGVYFRNATSEILPLLLKR